MLSRFISYVVVICVLGCLGRVYAIDENTISKVLFLPFDTSVAGKYSPLEPGLQNMLISRLAARDRIEIVDYSLKKKEIARLKRSMKGSDKAMISEQLKADYVASGALFAMEKGLQIQVVFHNVSAGTLAADLSIVAEGDENIINAMDDLSQKIAEKVFGYETEERKLAGAQPPSGMQGFRTEHPDKAFKKGVYIGDSLQGGGQLFTSKGVRKSLKIPLSLVSMAKGDLDGNGEEEIVLAGTGELKVFQYKDGIFKRLHELELDASLKVNAVNIADMNGDGRGEIYLSANNGYLIESQILDWSPKGGISTRLDDIPWYIRPLDIPGEGLVLIGQNRGIERTASVAPGLFRMEWKEGGAGLREGKRLPLPQSVNIFDFVLADLDNDGSVEKVVMGGSGKMLVYDQENRIIWVSSEDFGGSKNHFGPFMSDEDDSGLFNTLGRVEADERVLTFIPTRILVVDANGDGKKDIIAGSNTLTTYRFLENFRSYKEGVIFCLSWSGTKMTELWRTNTVNGYVADYSFSAFSMHGSGNSADDVSGKTMRNQLIIGQIPDRGMVDFLTFSGNNSRLLAYEMELMDNSTKN